MARLGDVCEKRIDTIKATYTGDIDYIDISSIDNKSKKITEIQSISIVDAPSRAKQLVFPGDILVSTVRPNLNAVALVTESADNTLVASTGYCVLRCLPNTYNKYVFYFCQSPAFIEKMVTQATGASYPAVTSSIVKECTIPLPPLEEQRRIAALLDKVSDLIAKRRAQLDKLDLLVKARFVEMFGDPILNQKGFPQYTVGDIITFQGGSQPDKKYFEYVQTDENIRLIQIRDYKSDKFITYIPKAMAKRFCSVDDIMIGRYGPPIFQILQGIEGAYNVALMKAIPKKGNKEFIRQFLKQDCLLEYLEGLSKRTAGQDGIQMDKLKGYPFPCPPIESQEKFEFFVKKVDKSKLTIQQSLDRLEILKKALMQQYFG